MKVKSVKFNWHQAGSIMDKNGAGDDCEKLTLGERGVVNIEEHIPCNGLEQWNYVVAFEDGSKQRIFNPNFVEYFQQEIYSATDIEKMLPVK